MFKKWMPFFLLLSLHLFILSKLQFTAWPEMVSFPYLINHGFVTYKDMVHAYPPLLVNLLAVLYKIFGYKLFVLKIFGWVTILVSDTLLFLILKKLISDWRLGVGGLFSYVILQSILEGNMVWPDLFIVPFLLLTFYLILYKKYFYAGAVIGLALLTKQTAGLYIVCSLPAIAYGNKRWLAGILYFILGGLVVGLPFLVNLIQQNSLRDFVNWTIVYPSKYWTRFPGYVQLNPTLKENLILLILFLPLVFLIFKAKSKVFADKAFLLLFGFLVCGILGVYPRFSFFHFQSALAFLVILSFYLLNNLKIKPIYCLVPVFLIVILFNSHIVLEQNRFWSADDIKLGQIIKDVNFDQKPIYLLGLDSNLYVFADRLPNKPWLDNFGWYLEIPGVQESVIGGFEKNPPSAIFWQTPEAGNWYDIGTYQPKKITDYIMKNYKRYKEIEKGVWELTLRPAQGK